MNKEPYVSQYIDDEERELIEAIESEDYKMGASQLSTEVIAEAQALAQNTLHEASTKVSIRIPQSDLARVKAQALEQGIPYQTLIKSIIRQAVRR